MTAPAEAARRVFLAAHQAWSAAWIMHGATRDGVGDFEASNMTVNTFDVIQPVLSAALAAIQREMDAGTVDHSPQEWAIALADLPRPERKPGE